MLCGLRCLLLGFFVIFIEPAAAAPAPLHPVAVPSCPGVPYLAGVAAVPLPA